MLPDKYKNKYRISSARLQNWDYRWNAAYFVTICTKSRKHYFGEIIHEKMELSPAGIIADVLWHEIKNHVENVELDAFVVMPNHIHGIVILNGNDDKITAGDNNKNENGGNTGGDANNRTNDETNDGTNDETDDGINDGTDDGTDDGINVETRHALSLQQKQQQQSPPKTIGQQRFQNQGKNSLSSIIGSYKSAVTKHAHRLGYTHEWQSRFHDHIIRDGRSFKRIQQYIITNPENWKEDKFNDQNPEHDN